MQWNGSIRFFVEAYFDFMMLTAINLQHADWQTPFVAVQYSNILSAILLAVTLLLSFLILVCYYKHRGLWTVPEFMRKFNTLIQDYITDEKHAWQGVAMIFLFMLKRAVFVVAVLSLGNALPIQIAMI